MHCTTGNVYQRDAFSLKPARETDYYAVGKNSASICCDAIITPEKTLRTKNKIHVCVIFSFINQHPIIDLRARVDVFSRELSIIFEFPVGLWAHGLIFVMASGGPGEEIARLERSVFGLGQTLRAGFTYLPTMRSIDVYNQYIPWYTIRAVKVRYKQKRASLFRRICCGVADFDLASRRASLRRIKNVLD